MNRRESMEDRGFSTSKLVKLDLKKAKFGSVSKDDLNAMISMWNCVECSQFPRQRDERGAEKSVFVLKCGHYLCKRCREKEKCPRYAYKCPHPLPSGKEKCDKETNLCDPLPYASHVIEMRWMLSERGFPCHVCRSDEDEANYFSRDLMFVCKDCTVMQGDGKWTNGNIFDDPRERPFDYDDHRFKYSLLCVYCARVPTNSHGSHLIWSLDQHSLHSQVVVMQNEDKSISVRPKWNMAMLSRSMMTRFLAGYLTCHCGFEYNSSKSEVKPVMLGCNHIVCSNCTEPNVLDRLFRADARCPVCIARIKWKSDPLHDLHFASQRVKSEYSKCEVCSKRFPSDRNRLCSKKLRETQTGEIKECPNTICFDCIRTTASKQHHRQRKIDFDKK